MAKAQAKAAPAPVEEAASDIEVGSKVTFLGYPADTPETEMILEQGVAYPVVALPATEMVDGVEMETGYILSIPNPDFNPKKKVNAESNPEFLETEVFPEEIELAADEEGGEGVVDDDPLTYEELATYTLEELVEFAKENEVKLTAAQKKKAEVVLDICAKHFELTPAEAEPEPEPEPVKPAKAAAKAKADPAPAKAKAATAKAEAKPAGKAAAKAPAKVKAPAEEVDPDEVPDLDNEDAEVLALIEDAPDLVAVAQELESAVAISEYHLGGVLYHIKKEKVHLQKNKKGKLVDPEYGEPGGFKKFLMDNLNLDYRKATYLIDIYINFTLAGLENPSEVVGRIGWTKASKIAKLVGTEGADVDGLLDAAEKNTVSDLSDIIKEQFTVGGGEGATPGSAGKKVTRITLRFRYVEEEANVIEDTLREASERFGVKPDEALYQIVTDWHAREMASGGEGEEEETQAAPAKGGKAAARAASAKPARAARA